MGHTTKDDPNGPPVERPHPRPEYPRQPNKNRPPLGDEEDR